MTAVMPVNGAVDDASAAAAPVIDLAKPGPSEEQWRAALDHLPAVSFVPSPDADGGPRISGRPVLVIAPHPDDESLGVGGTVALLADAGAAVHFVCLTDGEAAPCNITDPDDLATVRRCELFAAAVLLAPHSTVTFCGFPDGRLTERANDVHARLAGLIRPGDLVFAPLDGDGHPDHDVAGAVARTVADACGAELWWYAVWASHWHDPTTSPLTSRGRRSELSAAAMGRKRAAIDCHRSQLAGEDAVVPAAHLPRFRRPFELLIRA